MMIFFIYNLNPPLPILPDNKINSTIMLGHSAYRINGNIIYFFKLEDSASIYHELLCNVLPNYDGKLWKSHNLDIYVFSLLCGRFRCENLNFFCTLLQKYTAHRKVFLPFRECSSYGFADYSCTQF